jgi:phosphohistidine swiveling domain-containing protein
MRKLLSVVAIGACLSVGLQVDLKADAPSAIGAKQQSGVVINLAGKQRMLTQKMSKEALLVAKGVDKDANSANLKKTVALFDKTLKGLMDGDSSLNLPKTEDKDILAQLKKVSELWASFKTKIEKNDLPAIAKENLPLLKNMNQAVQMYAKASDSKLDPKMAKTINLAGKQRMLTQKMTKELLLVANNIDADANKENAKKTAGLFETTLNNLISETKNDGIKTQLGVVKKLFDEYKPIITNLDISDEALNKANKLNIPLLKEMNKAVKMYEASIK